MDRSYDVVELNFKPIDDAKVKEEKEESKE